MALSMNGPNSKSIMTLDEKMLQERLLSCLDQDQRILKAISFAEKAHKGMVRDEGTPYVRHPLRVALVLTEELGVRDCNMACAALLHDTIEDNRKVTFEVLSDQFGVATATLVKCLTNEFKKTDLPRAERKKRYLQRIAGEGDDCILLKLCDRLDNLRSLPYSPNKEKQARTRDETKRLLLPLFDGRGDTFHDLKLLIIKELESEASE